MALLLLCTALWQHTESFRSAWKWRSECRITTSDEGEPLLAKAARTWQRCRVYVLQLLQTLPRCGPYITLDWLGGCGGWESDGTGGWWFLSSVERVYEAASLASTGSGIDRRLKLIFDWGSQFLGHLNGPQEISSIPTFPDIVCLLGDLLCKHHLNPSSQWIGYVLNNLTFACK